uniref:Senescence-associated protein n=1 Tax=Salix viminalis TaxID=40686 RepID=A0A6N2L7R1_SALVM
MTIPLSGQSISILVRLASPFACLNASPLLAYSFALPPLKSIIQAPVRAMLEPMTFLPYTVPNSVTPNPAGTAFAASRGNRSHDQNSQQVNRASINVPLSKPRAHAMTHEPKRLPILHPAETADTADPLRCRPTAASTTRIFALFSRPLSAAPARDRSVCPAPTASSLVKRAPGGVGGECEASLASSPTSCCQLTIALRGDLLLKAAAGFLPPPIAHGSICQTLCNPIVCPDRASGSKSNVAMNAWLPQASYPCGNFSDTSSFKFRRSKGSIGHAFTVRIRTGNQNQTSFYPFVPHEISVLVELILGHLRYLLTDVPPQPNSPPDNVFRPDRPPKRPWVQKEGQRPASDSRNK